MQPNPKVEDILKLTITDGENPITGATVTIGSDSETSDESGEVEFTLEYGDYTASVSADGYVTATESLAFRSNHKNFSVTLEAATGGTGTVTVTCQDELGNPLDTAEVFLCDTNQMPIPPNDSNMVAYGTCDTYGTATLTIWNKETHQPTQDTDIPYDDYYLFGLNSEKQYSGALTVDGDEEVTITLTSGGTGTVTVTVQYEVDGQTEPAVNKAVMLYTGDTPPTPQDDSMLVSRNATNDEGVAEMTVYDTSTHQATEVTDIPFGTYTLFSSDYDSSSYSGALTVDGDETVTITLTQDDNGGEGG